jgi:predicted phosphodiesterase
LRYLILSDIHSNLEAFEKTRKMADGKYDQLLCLGDMVGYGPDPNAVIERVREVSPHLIIRGNHDKACAGITDAHDFNRLARLATLWTREQLTAENLSFLRSLPAGPVTVNGFQVVHGSPGNEDEYLLRPTEVLSVLRGLPIQVVLFGHTHLQGGFLLTFKGGFAAIRDFEAQDGCALVLPLEDGTRYLINPGSVGQPRDGNWRSAFAILDEEQRQVEYYRTSYEVTRTQQKMKDAGLPEPLIRRLSYGR